MQVRLGDFQYEVEQKTEEHTVHFKTYNPDLKLQVNVICEETEDTQQRWKDFWRLFAKNAAQYYANRTLK